MLHPEWNAMSDEQKIVLCVVVPGIEVQELRLRRSISPASRGAFSLVTNQQQPLNLFAKLLPHSVIRHYLGCNHDPPDT
jgi:hypothetical protein